MIFFDGFGEYREEEGDVKSCICLIQNIYGKLENFESSFKEVFYFLL